MKKHIIFINNYPSPYRNYLFNSLNSTGVDFEVIHEAHGAKDRNWSFSGNEIKYKNNFDKPLFTTGFGGTFNPRLLWKMIKSNKDYEYVIPGWGGINYVSIFILKRIGLIRNKLHVWCEANYLDKNGPKDVNGLKNFFRKFCMSTADGMILIPGIMAKKALEHFGIQIDSKRFVIFPNVIEDEKFSYGDPSQTITQPIFISPIRLNENLKGLKNFFDAIGLENIKKAKFLIAGDGVDKQLYLDYIKDNGIEKYVEMLGFLNSEQMENAYSRANAILLPSFYDPSPLSLIEATKKGLVILASNHCGNHFEAIENGKNGYSFNPLDTSDVKNTYERLISEISVWPQYSANSINIYNEKFLPKKVILSLVNNLWHKEYKDQNEDTCTD